MDDRPISRRTLLGAGAVTGLGVVVAGGYAALFGGDEAARTGVRPGTGAAGGTGTASGQAQGFGALVADPEGRLALPEGFRYQLLAEEGVTRLESGEVSPSDPDGAAVFESPTGAGAILISNHEVGNDEPHPVPHVEGLVYDPEGRGGTTTIEVGPDGRTVRQYVSLAGTYKNCAGGRTPWNTWLSCEETERVMQKPHGYVFEVDPVDRNANLNPKPIKALGRFPHEAVVVDPEDFAFYQTEDAAKPNGGVYRWTPPPEALPLGKGSLRQLADDAGTLEALRATTSDGRHVRDLSEATTVGTVYDVSWVAVPDRDAADTSVRRQFTDDQVTRGRKLEGMWWGDGGVYLVSSFARSKDGQATNHDGQVWFLDPRAGTMRLHLRFAPANKPDVEPNGPDNITVSPFGGVMIAEDGEGNPNLLGATPDGEVFVFARSEPKVKGGEFCGPVFAPDQQTLFANLQGPGMTFGIQGPFARQS